MQTMMTEREENDETGGVTNWETAQTAQFGHSTMTSNMWYGLSYGEMSTMRRHLIEEHRKASQTWHKFLQGKLPLKRKRVADTTTLLPAQMNKVVCPAVLDSNSVLQVPPAVQCNMRHKDADESATLQGFVTVQQSRASLECLRSFCKDPEATFKLAVQGAAVDNVLHTKSDIIAILPTWGGGGGGGGGGVRACCFSMYAAFYPSKINILVIPTIALKQDMMRRAREYHLSCTDNISAVSDECFVLVTPEGAESATFRNTAINLHATNRLDTIFIDEAHVFSTDRDFRPSVRRLPELTFLPNVRLVMLTATAPQWIMDDIRSNFFGQNRVPIVFRDATNRLNVRYEVNCSCSTFDPVAKQLVELLQNYSDLDRCIIYVPALELCGIVQLALDKVSVPSAIYSGQQDQSTNDQLWKVEGWVGQSHGCYKCIRTRYRLPC